MTSTAVQGISLKQVQPAFLLGVGVCGGDRAWQGHGTSGLPALVLVSFLSTFAMTGERRKKKEALKGKRK